MKFWLLLLLFIFNVLCVWCLSLFFFEISFIVLFNHAFENSFISCILGRIPLLNHHFGVTLAEVAIICHIHFMSSQNMLHVNIPCFNSQHVVIHRKHNKSWHSTLHLDLLELVGNKPKLFSQMEWWFIMVESVKNHQLNKSKHTKSWTHNISSTCLCFTTYNPKSTSRLSSHNPEVFPTGDWRPRLWSNQIRWPLRRLPWDTQAMTLPETTIAMENPPFFDGV